MELEKIIIHDEVFYYDPSNDDLEPAIHKMKSGDYDKDELKALKKIAYEDTTRHRAPFEARDHHFKITYRDGHFVIERDKF